MKLTGLLIFAVSVFALSLALIAQEKSAAQSSSAEVTKVSPEKSAAPVKSIPQAIKNARAAGVVFEERNLFHSNTKNATDDWQLRSAVSGGVTFDLNKTAVQKILSENVRFINLPLPDGKGGTINLELEKADIFAEGFSVKTSTPTDESANQNSGVHYRGIIKGDDRSLAAISIFKNEVMGFYSTDAGGNTVLGRLGGKNPTGRHILYAERDLIDALDFHCETTNDGAVLPGTILPTPSNEIIERCVRIYLEANYDLFLNKGNVAEVTAYLTGMFNQSAALYANDGISVSLSEIYVWNSPSPFDAPTAGDVLNQFKAIRRSFNGDIAHFVTLNREFGGISFVGSLCNRSFAYAVSDIDPTYNNVPTYSFSVYVFTHETGHNLGSPHTHACVWNGNNTAIDSCGPTAGFPYEGTCSDAPLPPANGGTIMSYCHRNVGINFSLGFGEQPRNAIINKINSSTCLSDCSVNCSVTLSPTESPVFSNGGGTGVFNVLTGNGCLWEALVSAPTPALNIFSDGRRENLLAPLSRTTSFQTPPDAQIAPGALFANTLPITILDRESNTFGSSPRRASPYPTSISVQGTIGTITSVRVLLNGLSHEAAGDLDILLSGPGRNVLLMSDVGGGTSLVNAHFTFASTAPGMPSDGPLVSGTYRPTNFPGNPVLEPGGQDIFHPDAPSQTNYSSNLEIFNGIPANGGWRLYIIDDEHPNAGTLAGGWALEITTTGGGGGGDWIAVTSATSSVGSGAVSYFVAENPANSPRTAAIMIRGRAYTVRQNVTTVQPSRASFDFDGDRKSDISVFRPSNAYWYINNSSNNSLTAVQFGAEGDLIAPADFDGDGRTDTCVFRPADGGWYRLNSSNNTFTPVQFGASGDLPAPGDFDGDAKADITVFRPSNGNWYRLNSSTSQFVAAQFGASGDKPLVADFDGDGKSDLAVFRPSDGGWYRVNSGSDTFSANQFGISEDKPVPADYDGDGKADLAVYRPSVGDWYIINSGTGAFGATHFGIAEDKPSPGDFDGDGKADFAVWRPSSGTWYLLRTSAGFTGAQFGTFGDVPTPNAYAR